MTTYGLPISLLEAAPDLERRETVLLHPFAGTPDPWSSHAGGSMLWPSDDEWPKCPRDGLPLVGLLQLLRDDIPELPFPEGSDVFELFVCPSWHLEDWVIQIDHRWLSLDAGLQPRFEPTPPQAETDFVPRAATLSPERVVELPSAAELSFEDLEALDEWLAANAERAPHARSAPARPARGPVVSVPLLLRSGHQGRRSSLLGPGSAPAGLQIVWCTD